MRVCYLLALLVIVLNFSCRNEAEEVAPSAQVADDLQEDENVDPNDLVDSEAVLDFSTMSLEEILQSPPMEVSVSSLLKDGGYVGFFDFYPDGSEESGYEAGGIGFDVKSKIYIESDVLEIIYGITFPGYREEVLKTQITQESVVNAIQSALDGGSKRAFLKVEANFEPSYSVDPEAVSNLPTMSLEEILKSPPMRINVIPVRKSGNYSRDSGGYSGVFAFYPDGSATSGFESGGFIFEVISKIYIEPDVLEIVYRIAFPEYEEEILKIQMTKEQVANAIQSAFDDGSVRGARVEVEAVLIS